MVAEGVSVGRIFEAVLFRAVEFNRATWIHPHAYIHGAVHACFRARADAAREKRDANLRPTVEMHSPRRA